MMPQKEKVYIENSRKSHQNSHQSTPHIHGELSDHKTTESLPPKAKPKLGKKTTAEISHTHQAQQSSAGKVYQVSMTLRKADGNCEDCWTSEPLKKLKSK